MLQVIVTGDSQSGKSFLARRIEAALRDLGVDCQYKSIDPVMAKHVRRTLPLDKVKEQFDPGQCGTVTIVDLF